MTKTSKMGFKPRAVLSYAKRGNVASIMETLTFPTLTHVRVQKTIEVAF